MGLAHALEVRTVIVLSRTDIERGLGGMPGKGERTQRIRRIAVVS